MWNSKWDSFRMTILWIWFGFIIYRAYGSKIDG
ncbi:MAG: hypothetical protein ACI8SE_001530 [Bacteroidia bacterium]